MAGNDSSSSYFTWLINGDKLEVTTPSGYSNTSYTYSGETTSSGSYPEGGVPANDGLYTFTATSGTSTPPSTKTIKISGHCTSTVPISRAVGEQLKESNRYYISNTNTNSNGGVIINSGTVDLSSASFQRNSASSSGGAIYNLNAASLTLTSAVFTSNCATGDGGAIYNYSGTAKLNGVEFSGNSAINGAAIHNFDGGITITSSASFTSNVATGNGGAIYNDGKGTVNINSCSAVFSGNSAINGGAVYNAGQNMTLSNVTFQNNSVGTKSGGAIYNATIMTLSSATFSGNSAGEGAAIYNAANASMTLLGDIALQTDKDTIDNAADATMSIGSGTSANITGKGVFTNSGTVNLFNATLDNLTNDNTLYISGTATISALSGKGSAAVYTSKQLTLGDKTDFKGTVTNGGTIITQGTGTLSNVINNKDIEISGTTEITKLTGTSATASVTVSASTQLTLGDKTNFGGTVTNSGTLDLDGSTVTLGTLNNSGTLTNNAKRLTISNLSATKQIVVAEGNSAVITTSAVLSGITGKTNGAFVNSGTATLANATFSGNSATENGGAVYNAGSMTLSSATFAGNSANKEGGAIYNTGNMNYGSAVFNSNTAGEQGGAISNRGNMTLSAATFTGNSAGTNGGAISNRGNMTLSAATFTGNSAGTNGGAISNTGNMILVNVTFTSNSANTNGGAIYNTPGNTLKLTSAIFSGNSAGANGGAIYNANGGTVTLTNVTFATKTDTIYNAGTMTFKENITLAGRLETTQTINATGADITLDISSYTEANKIALISDISKIYNAESWTINVNNVSQTEGAYVLASNADSFTGSFTITNGTDTAEGLEVGLSRNLNGQAYTLTKNASDDLILTVGDVKKEFTISIHNQWKNYDGTSDIDQGKYSYTGLENGDTLQITLTTDAVNVKDTNNAITIDQNQWKVVNKKGEDVSSKYILAKVTEGEVTINPVAITISSGGDTKPTYDGTYLTNSNVTVTSGNFVKGEGADYTVTGSQLAVGSSDNEFTYKLKDNTKAENYIITTQYGTLTVENAISTPITITAESETRPYDGKVLTNSGYTYTQDVLCSGDVLTAVVNGSITDAGSVENKVVSYKVTHNGNIDVTNCYNISTVNGKLEITKRDLSVTSDSQIFINDGKEHSWPYVTVRGDGFADGEGMTFDNFATIKDTGTVDNTFSYKWNEGTKESNYNFTGPTYGKLEVVDKPSITITALNQSKLYDGKAADIQQGTEWYTVSGSLLSTDKLSVTLSTDEEYINAGTYEDVITVTCKIMRDGTDVTSEYTINTDAGDLTINQREIKLESKSQTFTYDGKEHSWPYVTVGGNGFAEGEGMTFSDFTEVQDVTEEPVDNEFTYEWKTGTNENNYKFDEFTDITYGKLEVVEITTSDLVVDATEITLDKDCEFDSITVCNGGTLDINETVKTSKLTVDNSTVNVNGTLETEYTAISGSSMMTGITTTENLTVNANASAQFDDIEGLTKLTLKNDAVFTGNSIALNGNNASVTVGSRSVLTVTEQFEGKLNKLTVASGTKLNETKVELPEITGTAAADTISIGNYCDFTVSAIDLGDDADKLTIGNSVKFIAETIDLGDGANIMTIGGKGTTVEADEIAGISRLTISSGSSTAQNNTTVEISGAVTGTADADTVTIGNYTEFTASQLDLGKGKDTLKIGTAVTFTADSIDFGEADDPTEYNVMTIGGKANVTASEVTGTLNKLTVSSGTKNIETVVDMSFNGTADNDTVSIGNYVDFTADTIDLGEGADTVKIGTSSKLKADTVNLGDENNTMTVGSKANVEITELTGSLSKLTLTSGKKGDDSDKTTMIVDTLTGTTNNDTVTIGNYADFKAETVSLEDGDDTFKVGNTTTFEANAMDFGNGANALTIGTTSNASVGKVTFGEGFDKITIGKQTVFTAGTIDFGSGMDTFTAGAKSEVSFESMANVNQFIVSSGSKDADTKVNVSGKISFDTAVSNKLTIANYTDVNVHNVIDFNSNTTTMSIGSNSTVVLKGMNAVNVSDFTVGVGSTAYLSSNLYAKVKLSSKGDYYDIGSSAVAVNFTDIDDENSDDTVARKLSGDYNGWLNDELDDVDTLKTGDSAMILDLGAGYKNFEVNLGEGYVSASTAIIAVKANTEFGIKLADDVKGSFAYTVTKK